MDVYEAIDRYAGQQKIAYVHFRNVRGKVPNYREVFIDEGDVDMICKRSGCTTGTTTTACSSPTTPRASPAMHRGTPAWPMRWATSAPPSP